MWNSGIPPVPPTASREVLIELAAYYRQLTEYHQRSAAIAAQQLAHVEVLISSNLMLDRSWNNLDDRSLLSRGEQNNGISANLSSLLEVPSLEASVPSMSSEIPPNFKEVRSENYADKTAVRSPENAMLANDRLDSEEVFDEDKARKAIQQLLIDNRSKILRLDYIFQKLYGHFNVSPAEKEKLQDKVKNILNLGESQNLWSAIPDSPNCWTIELQDIPDLVKTPTTAQSKTVAVNSAKSIPHKNSKKQTKKSILLRSRLAYADKLANTSLVDAVADCLRENYPLNMTANEVVRWLYPNGLPEEDRKQARSSVSDTLNKRCGDKGWRRVSVGVYVWDEE
jgi:hypothetical protein